MKKIKDNVINELIIEKSRFITYLYKIDSIEMCENYLSKIRKEHYNANHNCYAYILDNQLIQKCSDDGEPQKTAGYPMLDVLKKHDLTNILAITTRYFGGIKLGSGGLIRAYSKSVSEALNLVKFTTTVALNKYKIIFDYEYFNLIQELENITIKSKEFSSNVTIEVLTSIENEAKLIESLKNITKNKIEIIFLTVVNEEVEI